MTSLWFIWHSYPARPRVFVVLHFGLLHTGIQLLHIFTKTYCVCVCVSLCTRTCICTCAIRIGCTLDRTGGGQERAPGFLCSHSVSCSLKENLELGWRAASTLEAPAVPTWAPALGNLNLGLKHLRQVLFPTELNPPSLLLFPGHPREDGAKTRGFFLLPRRLTRLNGASNAISCSFRGKRLSNALGRFLKLDCWSFCSVVHTLHVN